MDRQWINTSLPLKHFQVRDGQLLLSYDLDVLRYNEGVGLNSEMFEPTGLRQLKLDCAHIIPHILFTKPRLGLCSFPDLFACMFLLTAGRVATEKEISFLIGS